MPIAIPLQNTKCTAGAAHYLRMHKCNDDIHGHTTATPLDRFEVGVTIRFNMKGDADRTSIMYREY